jgi:endonuclease YncB( thermonuclease family)
MPRALVALVALVMGVVVGTGDARAGAPLAYHGTVVAIVSPGSLSVRLSNGKTEPVQLFGLAAPAAGSCAFSQADADITSLALGKTVWLVVISSSGGHGQPRTLLAYAILPGGADLGLSLVQRGDATVQADEHPFKQKASYLRAQSNAQSSSLGLWACASSGSGQPGPATTQPGKQKPHSTRQGKQEAPSTPAGPQEQASTTPGRSNGHGRGQSGHGSHGH